MLSNGILNNDGTIDVAGAGNALDDETVTNSQNIEVLAGGTLTIDLDSTVNNDTDVTNITVDGARHADLRTTPASTRAPSPFSDGPQQRQIDRTVAVSRPARST